MNSQGFDNTGFGFPASDFWGFEQYELPGRPLLANPPGALRGAASQLNYAPNHPIKPLATRGFIPRTTSRPNGLYGYVQLPNTNHFWPAFPRQAQPQFATIPDQSTLFPNQIVASGVATSVPASARVPFIHLENSSRAAPSTFDWDVLSTYQSGLNAKAGPSTLAPPQTQLAGSTMLQPFRREPETPANANKNQSIAEKDVVPKVKRARVPNGQGEYRNGRKQQQNDAKELVVRVQRWKGFAEAPTQGDALAYVLEIMPLFRPAVYQESRLFEAKPRPVFAETTRHAELERRRRKEDRTLFEELSRYYRLPPRRTRWNRPQLLRKLLKDLDDHPHLVMPPEKSAV